MSTAFRWPSRHHVVLACVLAVLATLLVSPATGAVPTSALTPSMSTVVKPTTASCPSSAPSGTLWHGSESVGAHRLCERAVANAATSQARSAIRAAFRMLGAPYACGGVGRSAPFRFDCSSLVSRAYLAAGVPAAGTTWASTTRDLMPWDGRQRASWAQFVSPRRIRPGDLVVYNTGAALSRHVVMYLGGGYMLHTNFCGGVAHIERFWGFNGTGEHRFAVARRVVMPSMGSAPPADFSQSGEAKATTVSFTAFATRERAATIRVQKALNDVAALGILVDGRWDGGMWATLVGFRRRVLGWSEQQSSRPLDQQTLRILGNRAGFTLVR